MEYRAGKAEEQIEDPSATPASVHPVRLVDSNPWPSTGQRRLHEVDGLRGWASLSVVFAHLLFGVFGSLQPPLLSPSVKPFFEPFLGGTLDVAVFFVLSGDALSAAYWARRSREGVVRLAIKRYFRLMIPIAASCLIVFALLKSGLIFNREAARILNVEDWLGSFLRKDFGIIDVFQYVTLDVFFRHTLEGTLDPFLWTMQTELLGSGLVFFYLLSDSFIRLKSAVLIFILLICLGGGSFLACFPFGVLCGYIRSRGGFDRLRRRRFTEPPAVVGAAVALVVGTYCNIVWQGWFPPSIVAACVIVFAVYASTLLSRLFATPLSRRLGRISFPLYLVHFPVIASFTSGAVDLAQAYDLLNPLMIWLIILASAAMSLLAAVLFLPVETLTARIGDAVYQAVTRGTFPSGPRYKLRFSGWTASPSETRESGAVLSARD